MPYQNISKPRFYIDIFQYIQSLWIGGGGYGFSTFPESNFAARYSHLAFQLKPSIKNILLNDATNGYNTNNLFTINYAGDIPMFNQFDTTKGYVGLLNFSVNEDDSGNPQSAFEFKGVSGMNLEEIVNYNESNNIFENSGFSLMSFDAEGLDSTQLNFRLNYYNYLSPEVAIPLKLGAFTMGSYYDIETNPDLNLTMEIQYDGVYNTSKSRGAITTQSDFLGSPWWYGDNGEKIEPWSIGKPDITTKRNGRRVWNLSFSFMSDKDLFSSNYMPSRYAETLDGYDPSHVKTFLEADENIVNNGTFDDTSNWDNPENDGWEITGGKAVCGDHSGNTSLRQEITFVSGSSYIVKFEISDYDNSGGEGYIVPHIGGTTGNPNNVKGNGTHEVIIPAGDANTELNMYADNLFRGKIDNIEVKRLKGSDFYYHIDNEPSFSSQVLNKISHGERFIFQPDRDSCNPSDFAICVLDDNNIEIRRIAYNTYEIDLIIREVF